MPVAWRLAAERYAGAAFFGEGARRFGGRWNSPGIPIVYTSAHLSLAVLETLVHLQPLTPRGLFVVFRIEWDDRLMETLAANDLPEKWTAEPPGPQTMHIGDQWFRDERTAVLAVPSVLIPEETNYLLNPRHSRYGEIKIAKSRNFCFDPM